MPSVSDAVRGTDTEGLGTVRLERRGMPDAMDARRTDAAGLGHRPNAPVGRVRRALLQRLHDDPFDLPVCQAPRAPGRFSSSRPPSSAFHEPSAPLANALVGDAELPTHLLIGASGSPPKDDGCPKSEGLRGLAATSPAQQRLASLGEITSLAFGLPSSAIDPIFL
jgi:hypothetical protein